MSDHFKYTIKSRNDKAINTLLGILQGIAADRTINSEEMKLLTNWIDDNQSLVDRHPYNEVIPKMIQALADGNFSEGEQEDLVWFCNQWQSNTFFETITADLQQLQAIMAAIAADGIVAEAEAEKLSDWIEEHDDLRSCWPYDEVESLLVTVLKDKWVDLAEQKMLLDFFASFLPESVNLQRSTTKTNVISGVCAVSPDIKFDGSSFCFTGDSLRATREEMKTMAIDRGARVVSDVSPKVNYLIVGSKGNPCWAFACYGRKIEKAMQLRKSGTQIVIVHEADFFDAIG